MNGHTPMEHLLLIPGLFSLDKARSDTAGYRVHHEQLKLVAHSKSVGALMDENEVARIVANHYID